MITIGILISNKKSYKCSNVINSNLIREFTSWSRNCIGNSKKENFQITTSWRNRTTILSSSIPRWTTFLLTPLKMYFLIVIKTETGGTIWNINTRAKIRIKITFAFWSKWKHLIVTKALRFFLYKRPSRITCDKRHLKNVGFFTLWLN